jgi:hypothetical protein
MYCVEATWCEPRGLKYDGVHEFLKILDKQCVEGCISNYSDYYIKLII